MSVFLPAIIGMFSYRKLNVSSKWIAIMVFFACVPHLVNFITKYTELEASNRNVFYNTYMILELLFLSLFFNSYFVSRYNKIIFKCSFLLCLAIGIIVIIYNGFTTTFLTQWLSFNNVVFSFWVLLLLYELYDRDETIYAKSLMFYLFGLFFYTSCTILAFGLWDYKIKNENSNLVNLDFIHHLLNLIMYMSFSIGFIIEANDYQKQKIN